VSAEIDTASSVPAFERVRSRIAAQVADGTLRSGTRLATVRQMAADLGLATNTVTRAYRELEADGVIATHGRPGTFVSSAVLDGPTEQAPSLASRYAQAARRLGLRLPEALALVERARSR
jgi:DNA-binding transcriptional regulator YhcF (GntR family)